MTQIAFIGGGNMARSLISGLLARGHRADQITVAEPIAAARTALFADFAVRVEARNDLAIATADVIVLAVKPQVMASVCHDLKPALGPRRPLIISIAAGITLGHLQRWLGASAALLRAMPNTPALIGEGISGLYAGDQVDDAQKALAISLLAAAGETCWIENEALMDVVTAVSGSGPAYFFLLMEAMIYAAIAQGLPAASARQLVLQTALGAARMAKESDDPPAVLRQRVTSPNGTTQAAIEILTGEHLPDTIAKAILRATERGRELSAEIGP
ncbi:MAG: pyrroline-5-carboxylate reductase [Lysobacterales bacterium CG02_land_8_20_14_3_00_62_12]|nr:MAG: pyrroline-5-carboxylate reductase [Xanthomonadales bacterium CG02_land_8_20_14_3_00_62_12]